MQKERYSVSVLREAADIQRTKSEDYQAKESSIQQADHYPRGVDTILDMSYQKLIRIYSVFDKMRNGKNANHESVRDSALDAINYLSFLISYLDHSMEGQQKNRDIFNKPYPIDEDNNVAPQPSYGFKSTEEMESPERPQAPLGQPPRNI